MRQAGKKRFLGVALCATLAFGMGNGVLLGQSCSTVGDPATHTKVGDAMPAFTVTDSDGKAFSMASQRGKVVLVNFWATWCGPCKLEIPRLEKEIWQHYKGNSKFAMVAVAREQTNDDIAPFEKKNGFTFPIASDPKRTTYQVFADSGIPRSYVVDAKGKILFQTVGYCAADFDGLKQAVDTALKAAN